MSIALTTAMLNLTNSIRPVCIHDLGFAFTEIPRFDSKGVRSSIPRMVESGMPRIPDTLLRSVFFLYPSRGDAESGTNVGGTGFIVLYGTPPRAYAVSNYHVAVRSEKNAGNPVIRLMRSANESAIIEHDVSDWQFVPNGGDVAAIEIDLESFISGPQKDSFGGPYIRAVNTELFGLQQAIKSDKIGPGEDVFMIGRFVDIGGQDVNIPAVRFGNISTMPVQVRQPNGAMGDCYTIDMHSRTGFSGSPVFAYRTFGQDLVDGGVSRMQNRFAQHSLRYVKPEVSDYRPVFRLLGIHCAQFGEDYEIKRKLVGEVAAQEYVQGLTGMTVVVPAWKIKEVLDLPVFAESRRPAEEEYKKKMASIVADYKKPKPS